MPSDGRLVSPTDPAWAAALTRIPHDVYHLPTYAELDAADDGEPVAFLHEQDGAAFLLPLVLRPVDRSSGHRDAISPYGYPGPITATDAMADDERLAYWDRACAALVATLREAGVVSCFVRLNPLFDAPRSALGRAGRLVEHGPTVAVDLTGTPEQRWSATRSNHRRQVNRARREGVATTVDDWDRFDEFIEIYHQTMKRVGAVDFYFFSPRYFVELRERLPENVHLIVAEQSGRVVAGGLFLATDGIVQYHLGATRDDALPLQPMKTVLVDAMAWGAANGARLLHLGGGVGGTDDPLLHFKVGFSPWQLPYATWRLATDPVVYRRLTAERAPNADPDDLSGFFPSYREP